MQRQVKGFARVTAKADTPEQAEQMLAPVVSQIVDTLGEYVYGVDADSLEQVVGQLLLEKGMTLSVAESCTGGLLSKRITDLPGASAYYKGGVCSYANEVKIHLLGVSEQTLDTLGAVSPEVAEQMAAGVARCMDTDIGVGITGIAGPDGGSAQKPVGLVYISVWSREKQQTREIRVSLGRDRVRNHAASTALDMIRRMLLQCGK